MSSDIMGILTGYKQSIALMAGLELGFTKILNKPRTLEELTEILNLQRKPLVLFLMFWHSMGLLTEEGDTWRLEEDALSSLCDFEQIIRHEQNIMEGFNTVRNLTESLKGRKKQLTGDCRRQYFKAMNGRNLKLVALRTVQRFGSLKNLSYLEWGNSEGQMSATVSKFFPKTEITIAGAESPIPNKNYDLIHIYNTVHYYTVKEWKEILLWLKEYMGDQSILCIADLFLDKAGFLNYSFLLDWITHGGDSHLFLEDLKETIKQCGLEITEDMFLPQTGTSLIFCRKEAHLERPY